MYIYQFNIKGEVGCTHIELWLVVVGKIFLLGIFVITGKYFERATFWNLNKASSRKCGQTSPL